MRYVRPLHVQSRGLQYLKCAVLAIVALAASAACSAQNAQTNAAPGAAAAEDVTKNPALMAEFGKLAGRLQNEVTLPFPREESSVLPELPAGTTFYVALPNYGDAVHQALGIFQQELQANSALRDWWQKVEPAPQGAKIEDSIEKFCRLSQYVGDEIVISGTAGGHEPQLLVVAQIRKPGFKEALEQVMRDLPAGTKPDVRVLDPQDLADSVNGQVKQLIVVVRPDFLIASPDVATLRSFNARLNGGQRDFAASRFGQRVVQEYQGGANMIAAADLHTILAQIPNPTPQGQRMLQQSGFGDMKYLAWKHKRANGSSLSDGELSFTGPRHGIASWLAAPGPMGALDFASPNAIMVMSMRLKNPADIFDDIWELASSVNPNACNAISAYEQMLGVNLRDDLFGKLDGELAIELDGVAPKPSWRVVLGVKDPAGLQQALTKLFTAGHIVVGQAEESRVTYYTIPVPSGRTATEITYAYVPGYLILSSSHDAVQDAIQLRGSDASLGKSAKFLESLPPGHPSGVSLVTYQDPIAMATLQLQRAAPGVASSLLRLAGNGKASVTAAYGEETSIRAASTSAGMDASSALIVAAIALPHIDRAKVAANDSAAVGTMRSVLTAQAAYMKTYPYRGYAPDLATLGRNPNGPSYTADHAGLLDATIANPTCTAGAWCTKAGFRFAITAACSGEKCGNFALTATPVNPDTGTQNFCAGSDGVIRVQHGGPLTTPVNTSECRAWPPLQ